MKYSLFVVVPVLNEEHHIATVIRALRLIEGVNVLVVDDNSSDRTVSILGEMGVHCLPNRFDSGRDGSIKTGLSYYADLGSEDWIVIFDGDGQHSVSFVEYVQSHKPLRTVFKGNRFSSKSEQINTPPDRLALANQLRDYLRQRYEISIADVNCGLLSIPRHLINWALDNCTFDKHFSTELCVRIELENKIELLEIPVPAIYWGDCPKHSNLYEKTSALTRFESRYKSVIDKIDSVVSSVGSHRSNTLV